MGWRVAWHGRLRATPVWCRRGSRACPVNRREAGRRQHDSGSRSRTSPKGSLRSAEHVARSNRRVRRLAVIQRRAFARYREALRCRIEEASTDIVAALGSVVASAIDQIAFGLRPQLSFGHGPSLNARSRSSSTTASVTIRPSPDSSAPASSSAEVGVVVEPGFSQARTPPARPVRGRMIEAPSVRVSYSRLVASMPERSAACRLARKPVRVMTTLAR